MKPTNLLESIREAGLNLSLLPGGLLKVLPAEKITDEIRQEIRQHKTELVRYLSECQDSPPTLTEDVTETLQERSFPHGGLLPDDYEFSPTPCKGCAQCEVIMVDGQPPMAGCVRRLDTGPWSEVWHRLPADLQKCILH